MGNKKFSSHRVVRKYIQYHERRKRNEKVPLFIKEIIEDEDKLKILADDLMVVKKELEQKEMCLVKDGIFERIIVNFERLDKGKMKVISYGYERLLEGLKTDLDDDTKALILKKLRGEDNANMVFNRILQLYDLYKFMLARETNFYQNLEDQVTSYRPTLNAQFKSIQNLVNFLWIKIEEKYKKTSLAFRFFDEKRRSKISFRDFENGIAKLRINLHKNDIKEVFNHLDMDKDKFLNYNEFLHINQNQNFRDRFPSNKRSSQQSSRLDTKFSSRVNSTTLRTKNGTPNIGEKNLEDIDKLSVSSFYYKGYRYGASRLGRKNSQLSEYSWISSKKHGIVSPQRQNINKIMNHSFVVENLKNKEAKAKMGLGLNRKRLSTITKKVLPNVPTKASKLREDYIRDNKAKLEHESNDAKVEWKIRKFLGIGPHEDIANSIRRVKKLSPNRRILNNSTALPEVNKVEEKPTSPAIEKPAERVDKKVKEQLLNDYFSQKREMQSSKRSNL